MKHLRQCWKTLAGIAMICFAAWFLCPKPDLYPAGWACSKQLMDRDGKLLHLALTPDGKYRIRTELRDISPTMVETTLGFEDHGFLEHGGVSLTSLARATYGLLSGQRLGGGSTLTMQLARLRWSQRTNHIPGKVAQLLRALQLERHYSKQEILEAYFNLAPYGGNVEGIGAASLLWCGKQPAELTQRECISLVVLPQSPTSRRPKLGEENPNHSSATQRLWSRLGSRSDALDAAYALLPEKAAPREVPHLARRLLKSGDLVHSTVDSAQQRTVEDVLQRYLDTQRTLGIVNGTALLVHAPSREVRAYVGSADFMNVAIRGQVDGITARRSPGSALKPFVYALAMDQGLIHTRTLLKDGKLDYADYSPENFERDFVGPISAQDALARSRNIPAIVLSQQLAGDGLYGFLQRAGMQLPKPADYYGLTLAVGGAEISPEQLATLYAMLASDGIPKPLVMIHGDGNASGPVMLTAASRYLTLEMLRQPLDRRVAVAGFETKNQVSWKTGTSHGFRDAWCAGVLGDYVLVVWLGNFQGRGNPSLVGRKAAAPLLFAIFDQLHLVSPERPVPATVAQTDLCAVSGQLPGKCCQHHVSGWFIPGVSPVQSCQIHQEVLIDPSSGLRVARDEGSKTLRREVHEFWPPDLLQIFAQAGLPDASPPAWAPGEAAEQDGTAPRIQSPLPQRVYTVTERHQSIPLRAEAAAGVERLFWFSGSSYLGSSSPTQPFLWKPKPGRWALQVNDDAGRSAQCMVTVE